MFGFLGGVFGLMQSIAFFFVQFVASRRFYLFVISKISSTLPTNKKLNDKNEKQSSSEIDNIKNNIKSSLFRRAKVAPEFKKRDSVGDTFSSK